MPYKIVKQKCRQSDGTRGNWVKKLKSSNKTVSCHKTQKLAQKSVAATYTNEHEHNGINDLNEINAIVIAILEELLYNRENRQIISK